MQLPKDLAGYQTIANGVIEVGDIICCSAFAYPGDSFIVPEKYFRLGEAIDDSVRVYRKMDCPRKLDMPAQDNSYKALTNDKGKAPLAMLPWAGIEEVALVQAYGNEKYGDFYNFRKGMEVCRHLSCAIRHISKYLTGEATDPESGRPHLAHAACRILYVLQNQHDGTAIDDRYATEGQIIKP
jgi:hypothetical protein